MSGNDTENNDEAAKAAKIKKAEDLVRSARQAQGARTTIVDRMYSKNVIPKAQSLEDAAQAQRAREEEKEAEDDKAERANRASKTKSLNFSKANKTKDLLGKARKEMPTELEDKKPRDIPRHPNYKP